MSSRQKLELTWVGKDERPRLEPRILLEDPAMSYHAKARVLEADQFDNRLIFGDNLLALKALEAEFAGKVKCVFIDPPYNTGAAFEHYDDAVEHSLWLSLMRSRLEQLRSLLRPDGSVWITLDDSEHAYCRVLCDEVFGRQNFVANVIWEKSDSPRMDAQFFSGRHDNVLVYARDATQLKLSSYADDDEAPAHYSEITGDGRRFYLKPLRAMGGQGDSRASRPNLFFPLEAPDGTNVYPKRQDGSDGAWRWSRDKCAQESERLEWRRGRNGWTPYFRIYADSRRSRPPETIWSHGEVGSNRTAKAEVKRLLPDEPPFGTPKPEGLLHRILEIATATGDIVLDSFAGSGTTGAVAHKMGRRWIMVEFGDHCHTHVIPRLKKVIDASDPGGVTEATNWKGGGGFRYFRLAPSLLERDRWGNWVISKQYNAEMLAEAVCKIEGFRYAPSADVFWQHGQSSEQDFIWVTTQELTAQQLDAIATDLGPHRSLLVCCAAWTGDATAFPNVTLKKLPNTVLARCEFGKDDYSLAIAAMPTPDIATADEDAEPEEPGEAAPRRRPAAKRARRSEG